MRGIAAFDVDHTITSRDCVLPFMWRVAGPVGFASGLIRQSRPVLHAGVRRDRNAMKRAVCGAAFRGHGAAEVDAAAREFATSVFERHLRDDTVDLLRTHRSSGDTVVLVSASFGVYLRPLADLLGVDHVLATELDIDHDGRLTGAIAGQNCRGPEKVRRLHEWLEAEAGGRSAVHLTAYGDSVGDRELLLDADVARWMGRSDPPAWLPSTNDMGTARG